MNRQRSALRRYLREIHGCLPCSGAEKKRILAEFAGSVDAYLMEHPDAPPEEIRANFGEPVSIAASYVDSMDMETLLHAMRKRRSILTAVIALVTAILIVWFAILGVIFVQDVIATNHWEIIEYEAFEVSSDSHPCR